MGCFRDLCFAGYGNEQPATISPPGGRAARCAPHEGHRGTARAQAASAQANAPCQDRPWPRPPSRDNPAHPLARTCDHSARRRCDAGPGVSVRAARAPPEHERRAIGECPQVIGRRSSRFAVGNAAARLMEHTCADATRDGSREDLRVPRASCGPARTNNGRSARVARRRSCRGLKRRSCTSAASRIWQPRLSGCGSSACSAAMR